MGWDEVIINIISSILRFSFLDNFADSRIDVIRFVTTDKGILILVAISLGQAFFLTISSQYRICSLVIDLPILDPWLLVSEV
jgi:hypothetical protein